eukprot:TRINITY_DN10937_c3_g1_i1.p1 TRINITY_DN10937_c3_g1~~TRINITY_DN10937_c3_g1_i1.p1  ORF type:complete len:106 (+),score=10.99 TRINITY_DN10937_c3_g1_i1:3-320(+)
MAVSSKSIKLDAQAKVAPNTISFNAAMSTSTKDLQGESALNDFSLMPRHTECQTQFRTMQPWVPVRRRRRSMAVCSESVQLDASGKDSAMYNPLQCCHWHVNGEH